MKLTWKNHLKVHETQPESAIAANDVACRLKTADNVSIQYAFLNL
jgi:hypothetical protein